MPRQGRINIEGGIYHVIQHGIKCREIYKDNADREEFIRRLAEGIKATGKTGVAVSKGLKEGEKLVEENNLKLIS